MRKLVWRIDENSKLVSAPCAHHISKVGGDGKGVLYEETRTLACKELKGGWKTDFSDKGRCEFEFQAGIPVGFPSSTDIEMGTGMLAISHQLVIEMIVAEEYIPKNSKLVTPTGAARVLRMQFNLVVTERGGLGISWEDECPPLYENVPTSPPTYNATIEDCLEQLEI